MNKRMPIRAIVIALALFTGLGAMNVKGGTLYFKADFNPNGLYSIDTITGLATLSGQGITGGQSSTFGLAPSNDPNILYSGSIRGGGRDFDWETLSVNTDGSGASVLNNPSMALEGLAYDGQNGVLYVTHNRKFWSLNPITGTIIDQLASLPDDQENLTFAHGGVYAVGDMIFTATEKLIPLHFFSPAENSWTHLGNIPNPNPGNRPYYITGLAYDSEGDKIYSVGQGDYLGPGIGEHLLLGIIDPVSLTIDLIGDTGLANASGGLAYNISVNNVPIPAALPLFASVLGVMGFLDWKRGKDV